MNRNAAKQFVIKNARPIDLAVYEYFFEQKSDQNVVEELRKYQNEDGGFGHGLEPDYWNPNSSPIATNDAILTLYRVGALNDNEEMVNGILRYLKSKDSFDDEKKRWLFAIESNKDYPHAIWWEKENDGIHGFNPTVSLAAFILVYGGRELVYENIIKEALAYLEESDEVSSDALKCYMFAYKLLEKADIHDIVDLGYFKEVICKTIDKNLCKDTEKYGVEYVPVPSDLFCGSYLEFITPQCKELIKAEKKILNQLQKEDGGFDITWQWYLPYIEFEKARDMWRPRLTMEKLLFDGIEDMV